MVSDFKDHIDYILAENDLEVAKWLKYPGRNTTDLDGDDIRIATIKCEESYCSALHEFGHIFEKTKDEYIAWRWAKENAYIWTSKMQSVAEQCLLRYEKSLSVKYKEI